MQRILSFMRRACADYNMIQDGDRIAVGISGGKDSLTLLFALSRLREFLPEKFDLEAITVGMGYEDMDFSAVEEFCRRIGVRYTYREAYIKDILAARNEKNPCSLCANLRRGALNNTAKELGCNKVALGHHNDDVIETFMLSLIYEGRLHCFSPVTYLDRKDITVIRPLIYAPEGYISGAARRFELPVVKNSCPHDGSTQRQRVKDLIASLEEEKHGFKTRLFTAVQSLSADGWKQV